MNKADMAVKWFVEQVRDPSNSLNDYMGDEIPVPPWIFEYWDRVEKERLIELEKLATAARSKLTDGELDALMSVITVTI